MIALIQNMSAQRGRELRADGAAHRQAAKARRNSRRQVEQSHLAIRRIDPVAAGHVRTSPHAP